MIGETSDTVERSIVGPKLRLPLQAAPIHRTTVASALNDGSGVQPSFDWGSLISTAIPIIASFL
jgi:hypothetical protein